MFKFIDSIYVAIPMIIAMAWVISKAADQLGDVLHILGIKLKIPTTVRGATFDAIASSFPEFATAMIAVIVYHKFEDVGVATIAGSGIFNVLLIPMASILAFKGATLNLKVEKKNVYRDMFFYILSLVVLGVSVVLGKFNYITGIILICVYIGYIIFLHSQTMSHRAKLALKEEEEEIENIEEMTGWQTLFWITVTIVAIWIAIDAIIASAGVISIHLGIPDFIVSVIIIAAATSIPDTLLSVKSAKRGDADGAIANAVGSNIFDICICLGVPMIIAGKTIPVSLGQNIGMLMFLVISMLITGAVILKKSGVKKKDSLIMLAGYLVFVAYIICVAIGVL